MLEPKWAEEVVHAGWVAHCGEAGPEWGGRLVCSEVTWPKVSKPKRSVYLERSPGVGCWSQLRAAKAMPMHFIFKLQKNKDKEKTLKEARAEEKNHLSYRIIVEFSTEAM